MKKFSVALLAGALTVSMMLSGCGAKPEAGTGDKATGDMSETPSIDAIVEKGKITMLTNAQFPPFEYTNDAGEVVGVDADVAAEIAKDLGVELEIIDMDFDLIHEGVKTGKGDFAAAGVTINEERAKIIDFTEEYVTSSQFVAVAKGSTVKADALDGLTLAVQEGTTGDFYASGDEGYSEVAAKEVLRFKSGIEAGRAVATGKADALVIDEMPAKMIVEQNKDAMELLPDVLTTENYAIEVSQDKPDLKEAINATLKRLKEEGKIDQFVTAHMTAE